MVIGTALALAATLNGSAAPAAEAVRPPASPSCGNAVGPFTVHGTTVLGAGGATFVSYGITVSGLQNPDWEASLNLDLQEIAATADDWCANTVRLQLSQDNLLGPNGTGFNQAYLNAIKAEVQTAESDNLVVVVNDSTEYTAPVWMAELGPTPATETFWKDLTKVYGQDPQVIFDLFNEPRMYYSGMSSAQEWKLWLNGGNFLGANYPFGMAGLARYVRTTLHAKNLFWIEGPRFSFSFAGMLREGAALKVSGVVYAVHHPAAPHDTSGWYADFGYLVTQGIAPVVDGEWTNYEPPPTVQATIDAHLVLARRADHGSCVPAVPVLARHRPERLLAPARLHDQVLRQPGRPHDDQRGDLELPVQPRTGARAGRRIPGHGLVQAEQQLTGGHARACRSSQQFLSSPLDGRPAQAYVS